MTLKVISAGFGRTGTMSLKLALEKLGFGPCYHMDAVLNNGQAFVPLWNDVVEGKPDWETVYAGYHSAVDWPTAAYWKELADYYPDAKMILSSRSAESWYDSISQTILAVAQAPEKWPPPAIPWMNMVMKVMKRSLGEAWDRESLIATFNAHEATVSAAFPKERLLVHSTKDGWTPLCDYLGVPVPETPYPRTNNREEFFELMKGADDM